MEQVAYCSVAPQRKLSAGIWLKSGWTFVFSRGYVDTIQGPHFFGIQDLDRIPEYFGEPRMSRSEAVQMARDTLKKLGYPTNLTRMDFAPRVIKSYYTNIPRCSIWWCCEDDPSDDLISKVEAEVDADKRELKSLYFDHKEFWNNPHQLMCQLHCYRLPTGKSQAQPDKQPHCQNKNEPATGSRVFVSTKCTLGLRVICLFTS